MSDSEYPAFIDPKKAPVEGVIERYSTGPNKFKPEEPTPIAVLNIGGELRSLWLNSFVLRSKFAELKPAVGERVRVEHLGMRDGANGSYHAFSVEVPDRPPYVPDWDALGAPETAMD